MNIFILWETYVSLSYENIAYLMWKTWLMEILCCIFSKSWKQNMHCICIIKSLFSWSLVRAHFIWGNTTDNVITCFWVGKKKHSKTIHILYSPCSNPCLSPLPPHSPFPKAFSQGDHLGIALTLVTFVSFCMEPE